MSEAAIQPDPPACEASRERPAAPRRTRRLRLVRQSDATDCAAACLAMVCRQLGRDVGLVRARQRIGDGRHGVSLAALCRGAASLGLAARAVRVATPDPGRLPLPAILHWQGNHWVVLHAWDGRQGQIADPASGRRRVSREELARSWSGYAALFDYTSELDATPEQRSGRSLLWRFARPQRATLLRGLGLALLVAALQMLFPVFTQVVVDRVLVDRQLDLLHMLLAGMGAAIVFMLLSLLAQRSLLSFAAVRIDAAAFDFLTRRLLSLPAEWFATRRTGDVQRRLEAVRELRELAVQGGVQLLTAASQLALALALMLAYSPLLTAAWLGAAPLYAGLMIFAARRLRPLFAGLEESFSRYRCRQLDAVTGIESLKLAGAEAGFRERLLEELHGVSRQVYRADLTAMGHEGAVHCATFVASALFLWVGAHEVMDGRLTIGAFVAFNALVALANAPMLTALRLWDEAQRARVQVERLRDVFDAEPEQGGDRARLAPVPRLEGHVALEGVALRYGPASPAVLKDVDVVIEPGTTVAVVGRSGSGKTTLAKLVAGLLEPSAGTLRYDGRDGRMLDRSDLRRHVGFVLQQTHLFDASIETNIALGDAEPDAERVLWAARTAQAHDFIERLPLGYDTPVGDSGMALSGGQAQRIAIARALYADPSLVVLDEATSFLDLATERALQQALRPVLAGRTCLVIAHRLATVREADRILFLEDGRIVEHGSHEELLARGGAYAALVREQLEL